MANTYYKFFDFTFDAHEGTLRRDNQLLKIKTRNAQVLRLLLENAGKIVSKQDFFDAVWQDAFVEDNNLTVAVAQIRKTLGETKETKFIETVPRKGYRFVATVETFDETASLAAESARSADLSAPPSAVVREPPSDNSSNSNSDETPAAKKENFFARVRSRQVLALSAVVFLVFLIGAYWRLNSSTIKSKSLNSVFVMPFSNNDSSPEGKLLADGLARDLTHNLGRLTNVRVIEYETDRTLDQPETDPKADIAISGRITTDGAAPELKLEVIDLRTGTNIWAADYSLSDTALPELQRRIAHDTARQIGESKNTDGVPATTNSEAFQAYLAARRHLSKGSLKDLEKSIANFTTATALDDSFADAHAGLAIAYVLQGLNFYSNYGVSTSQKFFPEASKHARRALELDPDSDEALTALAFIDYRYKYDWKSAESRFRRAIEINPNNFSAHRLYGEFLHRAGRFDAGFAEQRTALALSPNSLGVTGAMAWGAYLARRYDVAAGYIDIFQTIDKTNASALYNASEIYEQKGDFANAYDFWKEAMITEGANRKWIDNLESAYDKYGARGFQKAKVEWLENLAKQDYIFPTDLAKGYAALGQEDKALKWLEKAVELRAPDILSAKYAASFDSLRSLPRFQALLAKINYPE